MNSSSCTKIPHATRAEAIRVHRRLGKRIGYERQHRADGKLQTYFCDECRAWHLGHKAAPAQRPSGLSRREREAARRVGGELDFAGSIQNGGFLP